MLITDRLPRDTVRIKEFHQIMAGTIATWVIRSVAAVAARQTCEDEALSRVWVSRSVAAVAARAVLRHCVRTAGLLDATGRPLVPQALEQTLNWLPNLFPNGAPYRRQPIRAPCPPAVGTSMPCR